MTYGFASEIDNAELPRPLFSAFEKLFRSEVMWRESQLEDQRHNDVVGTTVHAVSTDLDPPAKVLEFDFQGFPDPDRYVLVQKSGETPAVAAGYFATWPNCWVLLPARLAED